MNWLNTPTRIIHSPEYVGSDPTERATWWNLMVYCAEQENGGIIQGCRNWKDRRWQQTCGVTAEEAGMACDLWRFDGDDLLVWNYPAEKEVEVQARRDGGRKGGTRRAENAAKSKEVCQDSSSASSTPSSSASTEEKRREEKGIEEKRREEQQSAPAPPSLKEIQPTGAANGMLALQGRIQAIKPAWKLALTYEEQQSMMRNGACLDSLDDADWTRLKSYMAARMPEGSNFWQPRSRSKFIESLPDVHDHACRWEEKNGGKPKAKGWT
jgi:hypothetical protein